MTSTVEGLDPNVASVPKKRRRRAAVTGASEDCFTCRKRQTKCDRRRPYCGQCLEIGKDCSGYRTTLTWGVGVASRGKLRGLSCPVARQPGDEVVEHKKTGVVPKRKASTTKASKAAKDAVFNSTYTACGDFAATSPTGTSPTRSDTKSIKTETEFESSQGLSMPIPIQSHWQYSEPYHHPSISTVPPSHHSSTDSDSGLSRIHTSLHHSIDSTGFPMSAGSLSTSLSTFSDSEYPISGDYSHSPTHMQYADTYPAFLNNPFAGSDVDDSNVGAQATGPFFEDTNHMRTISFTPSNFSHQEIDEEPQYTGEMDAMNDLSMVVGDMSSQQLFKDPIDFGFATLPRSLFYSHFFHLPPRMQYLLDYYNKHICSVLVAYDSSVNPYRQHVLELATQNEGLQNAIAALAINNIRMRSQERVSSIGFIEELSDEKVGSPESKPSAEESCYKSVSINQLQMQLADPRNAQDDSILATLLILCLFHVCDSGFSKFKTQLEGVQKLLSMRDPSLRTGFIGWVEMFFTWFDVMTSTVNDRETAIRGDRLDMMQYSSNLGALEEFSGCDGRLFKLIARLGRINLLSQNRPVRREHSGDETPRSLSHSRKPRNGSGKWQKGATIDPTDFTKLDGNGWGTTVASSDEEDAASPTDTRHEFWYEWNDVRARLQSWSMNPSAGPLDEMVQQPTLMEPEQRDMIHINESFRSSALLYTERLAHPHLPSSSHNFQRFVHDALTHITSISITSCVNKFLLWPLFIAGTECVDTTHRAIVRDRCLEIMRESGFYNNISVLEVLERVWAEQGEEADGGEAEEVRRREDSAGAPGGFGQAFRWRKAMDRVDGEYIIV